MAVDHAKLRELFIAACDLSSDQQILMMNEQCATDLELRSELEKLLQNDASTGEIFAESKLTAGCQIQFDTLVESDSPKQIGRYQIKKILGRGGMGVVYLAQQENPQRDVAIKVIRPGIMNDELRKRFELETTVLGLVQHPGVAQILEAGTAMVCDSTGQEYLQPFFAMEFVDGCAITEYAINNNLSVNQKLQLIVHVCQAVLSAHQRGVIHRDLKPSNILVTKSGNVKILDFGVARFIDSEEKSRDVSTHLGQLIGTLAYMSPEQVSGDSNQIDTRSDVYSIGVVLFELLCGQTPHQLHRKSIPDAIHHKREIPDRLSKWDRSLRGDIETMVQKTLETDKNRRYQSASDLAADINRYLKHLPIEARPSSVFYQLQKFTRRHTVLVASGFVVAATLITAGILIANYSYNQTIALEEANRQYSITKEVNEFLNEDLLGKANPNIAGRSDLTVRTLLDLASERIEGRFEGMPQVEAAIRFTLGRTYFGLGDYPKAEEHLTRSENLYASELGLDSLQTINVSDKLALSYIFQWKLDAAETVCQENLERAKKGLGESDADTAACHGTYAILLKKRGRFADAELHYRKAIEIWDQSDDVKDRRRRNITMNNLALVLNDQKKSDEAEEILRDVLKEWREFVGKHPDTAFGMHTLASQLFEQSKRNDLPEDLRKQKFEEATKLFDETLEMRMELLGETHPETAYTLYGIAMIQKGNKEYEQAIETLTRVLELRRKIYGTDKNLELLDTINAIGTTRNSMLEYNAAVAQFQQAFSTALELVGPDHYRTKMYLRNLLYTYRVYLKNDSAIQEFWDNYGDQLSSYGQIRVLDALSLTLEDNSKLEPAIEVQQELCDILVESNASIEYQVQAYDRLASFLKNSNRQLEAEEATAKARRLEANDPPRD